MRCVIHRRLIARCGGDRMRRTMAVVTGMAAVLTVLSCSQSAGRASDSTVASGSASTQTILDEDVLLAPRVQGGQGGWCMTVIVGECMPTRSTRSPIVAESWSGHGPPPVNQGVILTLDTVPFVSVDEGAAIPTRTESVLPDSLRTAVVELRGGATRKLRGYKVLAPPRLPQFTPLNATGRPVLQLGTRSVPLTFEVHGRRWTPGESEPSGACAVHTGRLRGLVFREGFVVSRVIPHSGGVGSPLLSCISASYLYGGWPLMVSVLVDALHPGLSPPALPGMVPVDGASRIFEALGSRGEMVASRIAGAWLVISGGQGQHQRLTVLRDADATIDF